MSAGQERESVYLIDAHSLIFQVFHALPEMSSPSGLPTNALFGFTKDMLYIRNEKKPTYLICAFDESERTFRNELYAEYKANRKPMPDDLQLQIPLIRTLLEAMHIPVISLPGYEADDVIATLAVAGEKAGKDVYICSSDKDCRQLITDCVKIFHLRKRQVFDREALLQDWGVSPEQVIDLQVLVGDSVDNVPGVPGIGLKTGAKLLQDYKTLDNVLANIGKIPGAKKQENLRVAAPKVALSRQLVRLATDVPLKIDWSAWRVRDWDAPRLVNLFREWGFHRFAEMVKATPPSPSVSTGNGGVASVGYQTEERAGRLSRDLPQSLFDGLAISEEPAPAGSGRWRNESWKANYHLINTPEKFGSFLDELQKQSRFAFDVETTCLDPLRCELVGIAFCWKPGEAWYVAVRGPEGEAVLNPAQTLEKLKPIFESAAVAKINQNIKYDILALRQTGLKLAGVKGDPMIADYLLHAGERSHNMETLADKHLQHSVIPITDLVGKKGKEQLRMDEVATPRVAEYAGEDADVAWRLCEKLEPELERQKLKRDAVPPGDELFLYDDIEIPLIEVLAEMEFNGVRLDTSRLERLGKEMESRLEQLEKDIHQLAGREFNIASLKQLREVLFDQLSLKPVRRTGITGAASTDQATLEALAKDGHELPKKLVEHRQISKLKGTYVDTLPALVNPRTGRVHASFNQTVAATGRLSSSDPNLQNIPIRSEQGGQIRQAFVPEPGWILLTADYSQIELRLLAHFSQDEVLRRTFEEDRDIHASVAAKIFGVPESEVTKEMRRAAKTVNFGVIYGMSAFGLAARLEIDKDEATKFIDAYFAQYPKVLTYQDELLKKCRSRGCVSTLLGRRRTIAGIRLDSTYKQRNQPEREAINMEIQGSAADLIKVAMLSIHRRLKRENRQTRMLLQIHDELVFEVPPKELKEIAGLVREEMTQALFSKLQVPLKVDLAAGPNWLEQTEMVA